MRSRFNIARLAALTFILVSGSAFVGCGGGGGNSNNGPNPGPVQQSWNVTLQNCSGLAWDQQTAQVVPDGNTPVYTATLDTVSYTNFGASGIQGTVNVSGNKLTFTCAPVHAAGILTGTSSPITPQQTWTASFASVAGATWTTTSLPANNGQSVHNDLRLQTGVTLTGITASDGSSPSYAFDQNDATLVHVTTAPLYANVTFTPNVSVPTVNYTFTFVDDPHAHFLASTATVQQGGSASVNIRVDAGYPAPAVTASDGKTAAVVSSVPSDTTLYTVACGPATGNCTFTASEPTSYITVPKVAGEVIYIVSPTVNADAPTMALLQTRATKITQNTGWSATWLTSYTDPKSIRTFLTQHKNTCKLALFVGNDVPIVTRQSDDPLVGDKWCTTDQYYRSLDYSYADPALDADGTWHIPGRFLSTTRYFEMPEFAPTFATAHIVGLSSATQLADIRGYLTKLNAHGDDLAYFASGVHTVQALYYGAPVPLADSRNAWANHPLGSYLLDSCQENTSTQMESDFQRALLTARYVRLQAHSKGPELVFEGTDSPAGTIAPLATTVVSNTDHARTVEFFSCFSGDYAQKNVSGVCTLLAGDTMLVKAATFNSLGSSYQEIIDSLTHCYAFGVGRSYASAFSSFAKGEWETALGDPTIAQQSVDSTKPAPIMVIDGKRYQEEFTLPVAVLSPSYGYDVVVKNVGNADLVINYDMFPWYKTAANTAGMPHYMIGSSPSTATVDTNIYTVRIAAGTSQTLHVQITQTVDSDVLHGAQRAIFLCTTNDPAVGAFRLDVTGTLQ